MQTIQNKNCVLTFPVAIVVSRFNEPITQELLAGALARLREAEFPDDKICVVWVPGAVEIPVTAARLAKAKRFSAVICLGAVVQGETKHFDYVCEQVSSGCQQVALNHDLPVIFGVLTTDNEAQAWDRLGGAHGHKGRDAVDAAMEMVKTLSALGKN